MRIQIILLVVPFILLLMMEIIVTTTWIFVKNNVMKKVRQEYENMNRIGVPLDGSIGSKTWDWEFWRELLNVISDGHV